MKSTGIYMPRIFLTAIIFIFTLTLGTAVNPFLTQDAVAATETTATSETVTTDRTDKFLQVAKKHKKKKKKKNPIKSIKKKSKKAKKGVKKGAKKAKKGVKKGAKKAKKGVKKGAKKAAKDAGKRATKLSKKAKKGMISAAGAAASVAVATAALGKDAAQFIGDQIAKWGCLGFAKAVKSPKLVNSLVKKVHPALKKAMKKIGKKAGVASVNPLYLDNFKGLPGHYGPRNLASLSNIYAKPNFGLLQYAAASNPAVMYDGVGVEVAAVKNSEIYNAAIGFLAKQGKNIAEITRITGVIAKNTAKIVLKFHNPEFLCNSTAKEKEKALAKLGLKPKIKLVHNQFGPEVNYADASSGSFLDRFSLISEAQAKKRRRKGKKKKKSSPPMWHGFSIGVGAEAVQGVGLGFLFITNWEGKHHGFFYLEQTISAGLEVPIGVGVGIRNFFFVPSRVSGFEGGGYGVGVAVGAKALAKAEVGIDVSLASNLAFAGIGAGVDVGVEAATGPSAGGTISSGYTIKMY